ncbi:hypothetical protein EVAR_23821_1 [Eumeta japonica]|uniref:Uncharacterized protein n=1 Tax=Eumeta variegata TaxID=151549 RepID=A0A4C1VLR5_EUMVA|nr:hypothetical protein EVAR_23821_1 [Eumeta japonica]
MHFTENFRPIKLLHRRAGQSLCLTSYNNNILDIEWYDNEDIDIEKIEEPQEEHKESVIPCGCGWACAERARAYHEEFPSENTLCAVRDNEIVRYEYEIDSAVNAGLKALKLRPHAAARPPRRPPPARALTRVRKFQSIKSAVNCVGLSRSSRANDLTLDEISTRGLRLLMILIACVGSIRVRRNRSTS